jgi:hypothetical protein
MKSLTKTDDRIAQIAGYYRELDASVASFQVPVAYTLAPQVGTHDSICRLLRL